MQSVALLKRSVILIVPDKTFQLIRQHLKAHQLNIKRRSVGIQRETFVHTSLSNFHAKFPKWRLMLLMVTTQNILIVVPKMMMIMMIMMMMMMMMFTTKYICRRKLYFHVIADNQQLFSRLVNSTHKWPDTYRKKVKFMMHDVWYPPVSTELLTTGSIMLHCFT